MIIKTGTIYKATSQTSEKSYIGQTTRPAFDLHKRIQEHINKAYNQNTKKAHFQKAILKYGYEDFEWKILEEPILENLNKQEVLWISTFDTYKNGYNCLPGGDNIKYNGIQKIFAFRETRCCQICGTVFSVKIKDLEEKRKSGEYCNRECWLKGQQGKRKKICLECGKEFYPYNRNQKYCNKKCSKKAGFFPGSDKIKRIDRECEWCNNIFSVPISANGTSEPTLKRLNQKYCGEECRVNAWTNKAKKNKIKKRCPTCNVEFETTILTTEKNYCSQGCYFKSLKIINECKYCGNEFESAPSDNKKFCSQECWIRWKEEIKSEARMTSICLECGNEFEHLKTDEKKYCSYECWHENTKIKLTKKTCPVCKKEFEVLPSAKFVVCCSYECSNKMGFKTDIKNRKKREDKNWKEYKNFKYHLVIYKHSPNYYMYVRDENNIQVIRKSTKTNYYKEAEKIVFDFIDGGCIENKLTDKKILTVLKKNNYVRTKTAKELNINVTTLWSKMKGLGIIERRTDIEKRKHKYS